nr:MAG TPA: hypothetical protein [Caudoviricetes sp.]
MQVVVCCWFGIVLVKRSWFVKLFHYVRLVCFVCLVMVLCAAL